MSKSVSKLCQEESSTKETTTFLFTFALHCALQPFIISGTLLNTGSRRNAGKSLKESKVKKPSHHNMSLGLWRTPPQLKTFSFFFFCFCPLFFRPVVVSTTCLTIQHDSKNKLLPSKAKNTTRWKHWLFCHTVVFNKILIFKLTRAYTPRSKQVSATAKKNRIDGYLNEVYTPHHATSYLFERHCSVHAY